MPKDANNVADFELTPPPDIDHTYLVKLTSELFVSSRNMKQGISIEITDIGYTPDNFKALVEICKNAGMKTNKEFYEHFNIGEQNFYNHTGGTKGMPWRSFQKLVERVYKWLSLRAFDNKLGN